VWINEGGTQRRTTTQTMISKTGKTAFLALSAAVGIAYLYRRRMRKRKRNIENEKERNTINIPSGKAESAYPVSTVDINHQNETTCSRILKRGSITIAHASVTGTCEQQAQILLQALSPHHSIQTLRTNEVDWWDELLNDEDESSTLPPAVLIVLIPTYTNGSWPPPAVPLQDALQELKNDWRIADRPLKKKLQVAVWGMGSSEYETIGKPARELVRQWQQLGAKCLTRVRVGDDTTDWKIEFGIWQKELIRKMNQGSHNKGRKDKQKKLSSVVEENCGCDNQSSDKECCHTESRESSRIDAWFSDDENEEQEPSVVDVEDMGEAIATESVDKGPKEMVTARQAKALKKEGYKLIGTHSAVKLCRWTKHQLRGRGGCYKHTFYGITSYQCMEATPSLACANKCVFCWRHHKNPVGKEWRWKTDDPNFIVDQAVKEHIKMIKEAKGIPGVQMDRWKEAHTVRHCALSLVGEPIMYPRIDEFLADLHSRKISTFLVTNGQHPEVISSLRPITQLYVSVDAPTKESLIEIDRPLFDDAWDRLKLSLDLLKDKGQRTVARLTVVKGWNSDEISGYAKLIALGRVSLIEIKGVTFCGKSDASNLNMSNSPWHHEVVDLAKTLKNEIDKMRQACDPQAVSPPEYDLACEHKHSVSVLLARVDQFSTLDDTTGKRKWLTWIDYDKFHDLARRNENDPTFTFSVKDYTAPTPSWALFGAEEEGFDPTDTRHRRNNKHPKYTRFDENGIPTHDDNDVALSQSTRDDLSRLMQQKILEIGEGTSVTELKGGEKKILDARNMFRGLTIAK